MPLQSFTIQQAFFHGIIVVLIQQQVRVLVTLQKLTFRGVARQVLWT
jgi:hypothetical protein